ncbi:uncharacterized protein LOC121534569 isoform X1 [Coregonus clupeaformis]|uniref:uncharacterized protein LOC121534569 isoform X1 n=1 Tax=Coregonus clupeaformis TaxID=59861 RepID=UPI001BDFE7CA|nr:uncharacterized protein LOC121534569 isoform X1 [Coregonus clupeaformis]
MIILYLYSKRVHLLMELSFPLNLVTRNNHKHQHILIPKTCRLSTVCKIHRAESLVAISKLNHFSSHLNLNVVVECFWPEKLRFQHSPITVACSRYADNVMGFAYLICWIFVASLPAAVLLSLLPVLSRRVLTVALFTTTDTAVHSTKAGPPSGDVNSNTWPYLAAALATALTISLFIVVAVKCRLFHRYLASYRHSLLPEGDTASQHSPDEVTFPGHGMVGRGGGGNGTHRGLDTDDDDGFIEDNYIQASERARAESHEDEGMEGEVVEDSDDDLQFTIG